MIEEGNFVRPDGSLVSLWKVTSEDIRSMSLADYGVYRSTIMFRDPSYYDWRSKDTFNHLSGASRIIPKEEIAEFKKQLNDSVKNNVTTWVTKETTSHYFPKDTAREYSDNYWAYVNATDPYTEAESLQAMLDNVTLDMQPNDDMSSWVTEPHPSAPLPSKKYEVPKSAFIAGFITPIILLAVLITILIL